MNYKACLNSWLHLILTTTETSIIIIISTLQMHLYKHARSTSHVLKPDPYFKIEWLTET